MDLGRSRLFLPGSGLEDPAGRTGVHQLDHVPAGHPPGHTAGAVRSGAAVGNAAGAAGADLRDGHHRGGIRVIPETITSGLAFSKGERGWWCDALYASTMDANVWTPADYPAGWEIITG